MLSFQNPQDSDFSKNTKFFKAKTLEKWSQNKTIMSKDESPGMY